MFGPVDPPFMRHELLRVTPAGWRATLAIEEARLQLVPEARRLVEDWAARGWPVIVRRPAASDIANGLPVGLPLPPSLGKLRLGFTISAEMVAARCPPVALNDAARVAPDRLRHQLDRVLALGDRLGAPPGVFGALLWQHLTGLAYLRAGSDLDLLWRIPARERLADLLDGLADIDADGPALLDGEVVDASGAGVNWRELREALGRPAGTVLVKSMKGAELRCAQTGFA